jgi:hypothetical protein
VDRILAERLRPAPSVLACATCCKWAEARIATPRLPKRGRFCMEVPDTRPSLVPQARVDGSLCRGASAARRRRHPLPESVPHCPLGRPILQRRPHPRRLGGIRGTEPSSSCPPPSPLSSCRSPATPAFRCQPCMGAPRCWWWHAAATMGRCSATPTLGSRGWMPQPHLPRAASCSGRRRRCSTRRLRRRLSPQGLHGAPRQTWRSGRMAVAAAQLGSFCRRWTRPLRTKQRAAASGTSYGPLQAASSHPRTDRSQAVRLPTRRRRR